MNNKRKIKLGRIAKDSITGFSGIIVAKIEYLTGCTQYKLQPQGLKDGSPIKGEWFDEGCLGATDPNPGGPVGEMPKPQHPGA